MGVVSILNPTPKDKLVDSRGRPYFLWDCEVTLAQFEQDLRTAAEPTKRYLLAKLMRQAKPDDVLTFVTLQQIADAWPGVCGSLGQTRRFWEWLLTEWQARDHVSR